MHEPTNATRVALECLTLWMEQGDEARHRAAEHIVRLQSGPDWPGDTKIITGLLNLSMLLVVELAHERDQEAEDLLEKARGHPA